MERSILIQEVRKEKKAKEAKLVTCLSYAGEMEVSKFPLPSLGTEHDAAAPASKLIADPLSSPLPSSLIISTLLYSEKFLVWMISYKVTPPNLRPICCLDCFFLSSNLSFRRLENYMYFFSICVEKLP